jgi:hypothetical protein
LKTESKFAGILAARHEAAALEEQDLLNEVPSKTASPTLSMEADSSTENAEKVSQNSRKKTGAEENSSSKTKDSKRKATGRRSSELYLQTSLYINREIHSQVMLTLAKARYLGKPKEDLSTLTERLLTEWLKSQP